MGKVTRPTTILVAAMTLNFSRLHIDHVQRDPFASPSLLRVVVDEKSLFPMEILENHHQRIAVSDFIARAFNDSIKKHATRRSGSGKSGEVQIDSGGQEILERSCVQISPGKLEIRFSIGLPARGRRVMGAEASRILLDILPLLVEDSCFYNNLNSDPSKKGSGTLHRCKLLEEPA